MKTPLKLMIVAALAATGAAAVALKQDKGKVSAETNAVDAMAAAKASADKAAPAAAAKLPRLLDLGAGKCIPCKMMAPILEKLKEEYAGRMEVVFIDVWKDPEAGKAYGVEMIPTQIFFDATGKELFRHTGFFAKEDILGKWKELGVDLTAKPKSNTPEPEATAQHSPRQTNPIHNDSAPGNFGQRTNLAPSPKQP